MNTTGLRVVVCIVLVTSLGAAYGSKPDEATIRLMNRGVGLMEQYRFLDAAKTFEAVVDRVPGWATAHVNLGIAYLNAVSDPDRPGGALDLADVAFGRAAELDPSMPHPHYCLGLLARYRGESDVALAEFQRVLEIDPQNADSLHFIGTLYMARGEAETAAGYFRRATDENPYLLSAQYSLAQALIRQGLRDEAMERLALFQRLDAAKIGVKRAMVYTEMGEYADAVRVYPLVGDHGTSKDIGVSFTRVDVGLSELAEGADLRSSGRAALADIDGDGDLDLYCPSTDLVVIEAPDVMGDIQSSYLYENVGGTFVRRPFDRDGPAMDVSGGVFGDYDNDGNPDLYITRSSATELYHNDGGFRFTRVGPECGAEFTGIGIGSAAWVDADHEGDLDLLVTTGDGLVLLRNNSDGTFVDITKDSGLPVAGLRCLAVTLADFDDDNDVDILVLTGAGPRLYANDRMNRWTDVTMRAGLRVDGFATSAAVADFDKDGDMDVLLCNRDRPAMLNLNRGDATFEAYTWSAAFEADSATVLDFDNDGDMDLFVPRGRWGAGSTPRALLLANDGSGGFTEVGERVGLAQVGAAMNASAVGADIDNDGDTDLCIAHSADGFVLLRNNGGNANNWLHIDLVGEMAAKSGYGAKVEIKAGSLWQKIEHQMVGGAWSATNPRIEIGLGQRRTADFVRILWPNGVLQSELEVAANQVVTITEVERKASSCPILFAWNGERFEFITDFMGVGGLGFFVAPGVTGTPDPTERVKLEAGQIAPKDGEYLFRIMEPMEEISYIDEIKLLAVDHPAGTEVYADERLATDGNVPSDRIYSYAHRVDPVAAVDEAGRDVLNAILTRDRRYPPLELDDRFLGHLKREHSVTVDFGDQLHGMNPELPWILYLYGWIEYPYSHTVYAAHQAGIAGGGIHVDVRQADGSWKTVRPDAGYPAGMPKMMTLDLSPHLSAETTAIRLRTNMEIYLDEVYLAEDLGEASLRMTTIAASQATLRHTGYPRESSPDGRLPRLYDYTSMDHTYAFKNMLGRYTRFGDVRELLDRADDQYVIVGRGEEIAIAFDASDLPPLEEGFVRSLLLHTDGFCKDMDPYTSYPDTVAPLPFHAMSAYPYGTSESYPDTEATRRYRTAYQTREK